MKNKKTGNLLKKILIISFILYCAFTFVSQQKTLMAYAQEEERYNQDIDMAEQEQEKLQEMKENINSNEYIEQIAREKLDMYYPNERVYVDIEK